MTEKEIKKIVKDYLLGRRYLNFKWLEFKKADDYCYRAIVKDDVLCSKLIIHVFTHSVEILEIPLKIDESSVKRDSIEI